MVRNIREYSRFSLSGGKLIAVAAISAATGLIGAGQSANAALSADGPIVSLQPIENLSPNTGGGGHISSALVTSGDTFSIAVVGFNATTTTAAGAYLTSPITFDPVFGTTNTYTLAAGIGTEDLTITSTEVVGVATTVDTFTVSVPTNFAPTGTKIGSRYIAAIDLNIGGYNAFVPGSTTAYDTIDYATSPTAPVGTGGIVYGTGNTAFALTPTVVASNGGLSYAMAEGVSSGSGATQASSIEGLGVHSISFSLTYPTVATPEPASMSLLALGSFGLLSRRRRVVA